MQSRASRFAFFLVAALLVWGLGSFAQAQHPTEVTSIVNSEADTSLEVNHNGSFLAPGKLVTDGTENDSISAEGAGVRMMWYPAKAAFRAGQVGIVSGKEDVWDADSIGYNSVAFGLDTKANSHAAVATGLGTAASGSNATAMGARTTASGYATTAMGRYTTASGYAATAMGYHTIAASGLSLSMGECNSANISDDGTLLAAGNGSYSSGSCSRSDALVLKENGNLGIEGAFRVDLAGGTYAGYFKGSKSGSAGDPSNHIAFVENTGGTNSDGLAIKAGPNDTPGSAVNYLTFFDGDGDAIGAIEGDGSGGITQTSGSGDFAEELPVAEDTEAPEPAELVGVRGGKVSLNTEDADRAMIASRAPILKGNATPSTKADDARRVAVAFIGQVPVKLRGEAEPGDLIVPSGKEDGTARAISPEEYQRAKHGPIAGQAWEGKTSKEVGEVTVAVGLGASSTLAKKLEKQRQRNAEQEKRLKKLEERLAALEAKRSKSALAGLAGPGLWLVLLALGSVALGSVALGGSLGAGLLWRGRS